jgi:hypothetical protein
MLLRTSAEVLRAMSSGIKGLLSVRGGVGRERGRGKVRKLVYWCTLRSCMILIRQRAFLSLLSLSITLSTFIHPLPLIVSLLSSAPVPLRLHHSAITTFSLHPLPSSSFNLVFLPSAPSPLHLSSPIHLWIHHHTILHMQIYLKCYCCTRLSSGGELREFSSPS